MNMTGLFIGHGHRALVSCSRRFSVGSARLVFHASIEDSHTSVQPRIVSRLLLQKCQHGIEGPIVPGSAEWNPVKNQYFGDINDYRKYGLLRLLTNGGRIKTAVCWMLTPDDGRSDGGRIKYLSEPGKWRDFDDALFDHLEEIVLHRGLRNVSEIENSDILPSCSFFSELVPDEREARAGYREGAIDSARGCALVFFDPDNGIEVRSKPVGRKDSSKYLYWHEIELFWKAGHSLLIYQHFPRVVRDPFIEAKARELADRTGAPLVISFRTSHVVFFLVPQPERRDYFCGRSEEVAGDWGDEFRVAYQCR